MSHTIRPDPLTAEAFARFGDVIAAGDDADMLINDGLCERFHDRAQLDFGDGRAGISLFKAQTRGLPHEFDLVERHPLGSQAFIPMAMVPFLVIVAPNEGGKPGTPQAFLTSEGQGINFHRGTWHGVLTPIFEPGLFAVIDRVGEGKNLEVHRFDAPYTVAL